MRVQFNNGCHFSSTNGFTHKTVFGNSTEICKICDQYSTNVVKKQLRLYQGSGKPKNSRSGPILRILDRFQTPQNANKSVQQVCAFNPIFPKPTNFHESMMSKKSQTVKSSETDNIRTPFKCDIMVVKRL